MGTVTQLNTSALPEIVGYVEAVTVDRVLGWAWTPRLPDLRLSIELRLGDALVGRAVAERHRPDLVSSGIGDGKHAFEVEIPEAYQSRARELSVWARAADGEAVVIGAPPSPEPVTDQLVRVLRGVDAVLGSQRVLHRSLHAGLAGQPDAAALAKLSDAQAAMAEQLTTVEQFVVRLDERLLALGLGARPSGRAVPPAALWAFGIAALALATSIAGLVHSLAG